MPDVKISQLPAASSVQNTDILPVVSSSSTLKATLGQITDFISDYVKDNADTTPTASSTELITSGAVYSANQTLKTLVVSVPSFSSLPQTISNASVTSDMVVVNSVLSSPTAQTSDWTVTTSNGSLTISGSISGSTTATLYLTRSR